MPFLIFYLVLRTSGKNRCSHLPARIRRRAIFSPLIEFPGSGPVPFDSAFVTFYIYHEKLILPFHTILSVFSIFVLFFSINYYSNRFLIAVRFHVCRNFPDARRLKATHRLMSQSSERKASPASSQAPAIKHLL